MTVSSPISVPATFLKSMFGDTTVLPIYLSSLPNGDAKDRQPGEQHVATRSPAEIELFVEEWDRADRGLFFCTGIVKRGARRSKENIVQTVGLHVDIDFKDVDLNPTSDGVVRQLMALRCPPSIIVFSGGGLHAYWLFKEALETQPNIERIEAALRLLCDLVAGDPSVCEVSRLMRLPGSHNTKDGNWIAVEVISNTEFRYELDDLEEWLSETSPILLRKKREHARTAGESDIYIEYAKQHGYGPTVDVEQRLRAMMHMGGGESGVHATQIAVTASLLSRGVPVDEVVERVLTATRAAAGTYGERWDWKRERRKVVADAQRWLKKHPEIKEKQRQRLGSREEDEPAPGPDKAAKSDADTPPPGMGHNSSGKPPPFHIAIANAYISGMKRNVGQLLRRVADTKGKQHIWCYRDGLWRRQSDNDAARSLHPLLQQIVNDLGRENKSSSKLFNEATAHVLRSAEVCRHEPVRFDAHGKVPTIHGLIDPITRAREPFKPEHYATWCLPVHFDESAACPHWERLLNDAFADMSDDDRKITIRLVQEVIGMALIDDKPKSLSRALVFFGLPDTGKTVVLKVVTALFGGAITTPFAKLDGSHGLQSFEDRLPWVLGEAFNQSGWYVTDHVKSIITGDPVEINPKGIPAISKKANTPAFWGTNHPPKFKESSGAMATRMVIIPMTRTFDKNKPVGVAAEARKRNPAWEPFDLIINTELPGVLNWALVGLKRALERGHFVNTQAGNDLLEQSRKDSNVVAAFVEECVTHDLAVMMLTTDFYAAFKEWWISEHGEKASPPSPTHVGLQLAALPNSRIAQNKDKFKLSTGQRFYIGGYLNAVGERFWQDAANTARLLKPQSRSLERDKPLNEPVPKKWKEMDEYRRAEANTFRVKEDQHGEAAASDASTFMELEEEIAHLAVKRSHGRDLGYIIGDDDPPAKATASAAHDDGLDIPDFLRRQST